MDFLTKKKYFKERQLLYEQMKSLKEYGDIVEIDNKMVCMVKVFPSKQGPVFIKNQGTKEFWLRTAVSTKIISDVEAIVKYCLGRWRDHTL